MRLRAATLHDLALLTGWIPDEKSCRYWAGPGVNFPFTINSLKADIHYSQQNTFSLINEHNDLIGLGQIIEKENFLHLARIIIAPDFRGRGYGKILCQKLIAKGKRKYGERPFSLNVYVRNTNALELYKQLGFAPVNRPEVSDSLYMILS